MARAQEVEGLQKTLRLLREFDKDLVKDLKKDLTKKAQPIFSDARSRIPDRALSGWSNKGRLGYSPARARSGMKVSVRLSKRVRGMKGSMASVSLSQGNAAGAIFDQAGQRGKYSPPVQRGAAFVDALNRKHGKAQRALWPAAVGKLPEIRRSFIASIKVQESRTNQKLKRY